MSIPLADLRRSEREGEGCAVSRHRPTVGNSATRGPISDLSVRQSQRPPPPPLRPCPGRAHEPPFGAESCGFVDDARKGVAHKPTGASNSSKQVLTQFVVASNASPRLTLTPIRCQKSTGQQAAARPGGIIPQSRATSSRNGGRHHSGIPGRLRPESAPISVMNSRRLIAFPKAQDKAL